MRRGLGGVPEDTHWIAAAGSVSGGTIIRSENPRADTRKSESRGFRRADGRASQCMSYTAYTRWYGLYTLVQMTGRSYRLQHRTAALPEGVEDSKPANAPSGSAAGRSASKPANAPSGSAAKRLGSKPANAPSGSGAP
jgi:hypothetical protein